MGRNLIHMLQTHFFLNEYSKGLFVLKKLDIIASLQLGTVLYSISLYTTTIIYQIFIPPSYGTRLGQSWCHSHNDTFEGNTRWYRYWGHTV